MRLVPERDPAFTMEIIEPRRIHHAHAALFQRDVDSGKMVP